MQQFSIPYILLIALCSSGCQPQSSASTQESYAGLFNVRCLQPNNRYHAEVRFSKDAANGELNAEATLPKEVLFQENKMGLLKEMSIFTSDGNLKPSSAAVFEWEHPKGTKRTFTMDIRPITKPSFLKSPASHKVANSMLWEGKPLGESESLVLFMENEKGETHTIPVTGAATQARLDIPAAEMVKMPLGLCKYYLIRRHATLHKSSNLKLNGILEYYSDEATIVVVK